jgi:hypothetical protein
MGSAPASGVVNRALAVHRGAREHFTIRCPATPPCSARGRVEPQPERLRSPGFPYIRIWLGKILPAIFLLALAGPTFADFTFVHPGLLQSRADLERMKTAVAAHAEPIYSGYLVFCSNAESQLSYKIRGPLTMVGRNPTVGQAAYDSDANAAYQCAIRWCITGNRAYADKAKAIINAWSETLTNITGRDAVLMAGLGPFKMVNAAELLRYTDAGWSSADVQRAERNFCEVIYPVIKNFAPFANGNWDSAAEKTVLAIAVFCNDRPMFERALRYYEDGTGDGSLPHYVINDVGQCQESGRDQQHTQLGLAHLGDCCEIAWHQGLNLYGYNDNRLLKGFEYTAKYNLGETVPFIADLDRTGKYHHTQISSKGRGGFRAVFEEIYNAYANRLGAPTPFTQQVVEKIRPEGAGVPSQPQGADHVGFGTLLFAQPISSVQPTQLRTAPAASAGLLANGSTNSIRLTWIASIGANRYTVERAASDGDYAVITRDVSGTSYADTTIKPGEMYHYRVVALNAFGKSQASFPVAICAGLPEPWTQLNVGSVSVPGNVNYDGQAFTLEGAGNGFAGTNDQFQFAYRPLKGNGSIIARFVPQTSSQFSQFGLMLRASPAAGSAAVALLISPHFNQDVEAPGWRAQLIVRDAAGASARVVGSGGTLSEPIVTFGRLTGYCWLKLERTGNRFVASFSSDGKTWTHIGLATIALKPELSAGLTVCSRLRGITTAVKFDHVTVSQGAAQNNATTDRQVESPDGKVTIGFRLQTGGVPAYYINYLGKPLVLESRLGLAPGFTNGFQPIKTNVTHHAGSWTNAFGERRVVPDNYNEMTVSLRRADGHAMRLIFRAYNEGAAFRYVFPGNAGEEFHFTGEDSEFCFPAGTYGYEEHGTEGEYHRVPVADIQPQCERPLTLEYADGLYAGLCEADNSNYPRLLLSPEPGKSGALVSALGGTTANTTESRFRQRNDPSAILHGGDATPWRLFIVGQKPGDLLERNYLVLDLNPPCALADTSWIRPGKVMRDVTLTNTNARAIIDFAATAGLRYVLFDSGWYGPESAENSDPTTVARANLNLPEVIRYGKEKGIGVILYVNRRHAEKLRDVIFPLYEKWGVAGVKLGFVNVGPQADTAWIAETIRKAAEHHLLLNIHDGYRPTGLARTWPNLLTVEGVRGNEHFPTAEHNCTLPFTRYLAGFADYTVCYYSPRLKNTTHAHQLAMAVVSFSPLQSIFWYDKPSDYHGEPEIEFFQHVPTVWDDTKVLAGEIGQYAAIARRSGDAWFIGVINDGQPRTLKLPLAFLGQKQKYMVHIYSDDDSIKTRTHVAVTTRLVDGKTLLTVPLKPTGGEAIWLAPVSEK